MLAAAVASSLLLSSFVAPAGAAADVPPVASSGDVVISEITNGGRSGGADAFFELHNTSAKRLSLRGWSVYRCDEDGLRAKSSVPEVILDDVVLAPGGRFTAAQMSAALPVEPDAVFSRTVSTRGFGLVLIAPDASVSDSFAAYPSTESPGLSECGPADVPAALAWALGESWQRDTSGEWVRSSATPGAPFVAPARALRPPRVRIVEIAPAGAAGSGDDIVELQNTGTVPVPLDGWRLYRCTALGEASAETLQHTFADGTVLAPGDRLLVGGPDFPGDPDVRTSPSLADLVSGVLLTTGDGARVDGVSVSAQYDTACQSGAGRLDGILDYRTGESWQLTDEGVWVVAARTPLQTNAEQQRRPAVNDFSYAGADVAISEVATDPELPAGHVRHAYVELGNYGSATVDLSGWKVIGCRADGFRALTDLAVVPAGTTIAPGATWTAALAGTAAARTADVVFTTPFPTSGGGVWVEDAAGRRMDSVGVFHRNEMDESVERRSPCTKGLGLATFAVDRLRGETYQRAGFTGDDATDFVAAEATPDRIDRRLPVDTAALLSIAGVASPQMTRAAAPLSEARSARARPSPEGEPAVVLSAVAGSAPEPLRAQRGVEETEVTGEVLTARDDGYDLPYLRMTVRVPATGGEIVWSGRVVGRTAVAMSVWDPSADRWRGVDQGQGGSTAPDGDAEATVDLTGLVRPGEVVNGSAEILVQVVPRTVTADAGGIADPADYDVALAHITDTQYLSESYPEVYAAEVAWITRNAAERKIGFAVHTGDLIQSWVDPDQREDRARREFGVASVMQAALDARVPNSVLPGNHDNKRGLTNELFNEYFGPDRYAGRNWFGGSITPNDNRASWSWFEAAGARFVVVSLPYAYGEEEVRWAESVVAEHTDANVVIATHEHVTPKGHGGPAARSNSSRWVSHADLLWDRVIAPHRNVVLVLSGHFHGVGALVTEDAGGIPGHTVVEAVADYQEFRTPTGERATGFQRLLQLDLAGGALAVDTFSVPLSAAASHPYDYVQFVPDNGTEGIHSNERPWNVLGRGLQNRYTEEDDAFEVPLTLQFAKAVETDALTLRQQ
jgi:hypothetical protein